MVDIVLRGDTVVTPQGVGAYDLAIAGERIVAVAAKDRLPVPEGARLIGMAVAESPEMQARKRRKEHEAARHAE